MAVPSAAAMARAPRWRTLAFALQDLGSAFAAEREQWVLWMPVLIGAGIAAYFALPTEPPLWPGVSVLAATLTAAVLARSGQGAGYPLLRVLTAITLSLAMGFAAAQLRASLVQTQMLAAPVGPTMVEGRVVQRESFPDGVRVTLDRVSVARLSAAPQPSKVRLRLRGEQPAIAPGNWLRVRAMVMPPPAPAVPGGYDFQRQAYFEGLGAVGYSLGKASVTPDAGPDADGDAVDLWFSRLRHAVGERVRRHLDGATAAVTIALLTGEQRAIPDAVMADIRDSGLAHLLSISGLHIGLVAGIVFVVVRSGLALIPFLALRFPIKKWAAVISVLAAGAYTLLADAPVPSQRSFLMVAIALLAVLVDRQGISMRLVAFAALLILLTQPASLLGPSFQMSFAAVVALIAAYEAMRQRQRAPAEQPSTAGRMLRYLGGVTLSTLIAGTATAPYAAFHFNRFQVYGVAANMVAVPVTGFWIMPWAVIAMLLMPFGLDGPAVIAMGWGVDVVIWIAHAVAAWPGSVVLLPAMPVWGLAAVTLGGLWLCLWRGRWRILGLAGLAIGAFGLATAPIPDLFVDGGGRLMAVRDPDGGGLIVSSKATARAARDAWLRRVGADASAGAWPKPGEATADGQLRCDTMGCVYRRDNQVVALARRAEALADDCQRANVVISLVPIRQPCPSAAGSVIDRFDLWHNGTHSVRLSAARVVIDSVAETRGDRPWVIGRRNAENDDADDDDAAELPAGPGASSDRGSVPGLQ